LKKILHIIFPTFSEWQTGIATSIISWTHQVVHAGLTREAVRSEGGLTCLPELRLTQVDPTEFAGMLIPGGLEMLHVAEAPELHALLRAFHRAGRPLAAISGGVLPLARAGLLDRLPYTTCLRPEQRAFLQLPEKTYRDRPLIRSERLVTGKGWAAIDFGLAVADLFAAWRDPEHAGSLQRYFRR